MQVILLEDVKALGKKGEIVKVSDGYATNFVLPKKLGVLATAANLNELKVQKKREDKAAAEQLAAAKEFAAQIEEKIIRVSIKSGEGGKVFGSVSSTEISVEAKKQFGFDIDKKKIQLSEPIKAFGSYEIPVKLHPQVTAKLTVAVSEK